MTRRHRLRWLPEAFNDLQDARGWYEQQHPGLGAAFITAFWRTVSSIDANPHVPRIVEHDSNEAIRRWHFDGWPYSVVYLAEDDTVIIVAVHHDRRLPNHWIRRL